MIEVLGSNGGAGDQGRGRAGRAGLRILRLNLRSMDTRIKIEKRERRSDKNKGERARESVKFEKKK